MDPFEFTKRDLGLLYNVVESTLNHVSHISFGMDATTSTAYLHGISGDGIAVSYVEEKEVREMIAFLTNTNKDRTSRGCNSVRELKPGPV